MKQGWVKCPKCNYTQKEQETCEYCKASLARVIRIRELENRIHETEEKIKGTEQEARKTPKNREKVVWIVFAVLLIVSVGIWLLYVPKPKSKVTRAYETAKLSKKPWEVEAAIKDLYSEWVDLSQTCKSYGTCLQLNDEISAKVYRIIAHIGKMERKSDNAYIKKDWEKCFQMCQSFNLEITYSNLEIKDSEEYRRYLDQRFK